MKIGIMIFVGQLRIQCIIIILSVPFFKIFIAFSISWRLEAPVDKITGFFVFDIFSINGIFVISDEEILKVELKDLKILPTQGQREGKKVNFISFAKYR